LLILYSFSPDSLAPTPFDQITLPTLENKLRAKPEVHHEHLELQRFSNDQHRRALVQHLQDLYSGRNIDDVVTIGFPTLDFVRQFKLEVPPTLPVVFVAVEHVAFKESCSVPK
jgi:hypothetical protein